MEQQNRFVVFVCIFLLMIVGRARGDVDISKFGAVGDGKTLATAAVQRAINTTSAAGGGVVSVPAGRFLIGTVVLKDNVTLRLEKDATLVGSPSLADYLVLDTFQEGTNKAAGVFLVGAVDAKNVGLEGAGTIDGQGSQLQNQQIGGVKYRPFLVRWVRCEQVSVKDVHLTSAAMWCMHLSQCKHVDVDAVSIVNRGNGNNDGIDVDSCDTVHISHCDIDSGDDSLCLKATGTSADENIQIDNCRLKSNDAAVKFGTETVGDFTNITISHCQIRDTRLGGIKILSVDGSRISNITLDDLVMDGVNVPIFLRLGSRLKTYHAGDKPRDTGSISHVSISNITAKGARQVGIMMMGVPGHPVGGDVTLAHIDLQMDGVSGSATAGDSRTREAAGAGNSGGDSGGASAAGSGKSRADGSGGAGAAGSDGTELAEKENAYPEITMFGKSLPGTGLVARHVKGLTVSDFRFSMAKADERPIAWLNDVVDVRLANCNVSVVSAGKINAEGALPAFVSVSGKESADIRLENNNDERVVVGPEVAAGAVK